MRWPSLVILVLVAACGAHAPDDSSLPPECPREMQSPTYCFAGSQGTAAPCGPCATVGARCDYFEATLVCACDHQWRCAYAGGSSGGCRDPDGGVVCN